MQYKCKNQGFKYFSGNIEILMTNFAIQTRNGKK